jgi:hypothetical protein
MKPTSARTEPEAAGGADDRGPCAKASPAGSAGLPAPSCGPENQSFEVAPLAREIVGVMAILAARPDIASDEIGAGFIPRDQITPMAARVLPDLHFLPAEDWPLARRHVKMLQAQETSHLSWPPITCMDAQAAWLGTPPGESCSTIKAKAETARTYDLGESPLWLLVVYEVFGDPPIAYPAAKQRGPRAADFAA